MIAAIYARKSTDQSGTADDAKSVVRQIDNARAYAARKGWVVSEEHIYVDDGISGAEFERRPGFMRLLAAASVKRPPFGVIVMSEESRLGREQIETSFALKTIIQHGVRVFYYLTNHERTLDSPTDKLLLSVSAFADEVEREKGRQRTRDAMERLAKAGHVTGGRVFGYDNVDVLTPDGRRSHVERRIKPEEAAVVRRVFALCAQGHGLRAIAHRLNAEAAASPRPQRGRPRGWAPSTVRCVIYRRLYAGEVEWARTQKRDRWGRVRPSRTPDAVIRAVKPELAIVSEAEWRAAHARLADSRLYYLRTHQGRVWGNPGKGAESKYLLVGMATCGVCGASLAVTSRASGAGRGFRYRCSANHRKGATVCGNAEAIPMAALDRAVLESIERQVLAPDVIEQIVGRALAEWSRPKPAEERERVAAALRDVDAELGRLTTALAAGADTPSVIEAIKAREAKRTTLQARLTTLSQTDRVVTLDAATVRQAVRERLTDWSGLMARHTPQARQLLRKVLHGRVMVQPTPEREDCYAEITATASISKVLAGSVVLPQALASPKAVDPYNGVKRVASPQAVDPYCCRGFIPMAA